MLLGHWNPHPITRFPRGVLCKSLGGGVLLGHWNPHPITRFPRGVLCKSLGGGVLMGHWSPHPTTRFPRGLLCKYLGGGVCKLIPSINSRSTLGWQVINTWSTCLLIVGWHLVDTLSMSGWTVLNQQLVDSWLSVDWLIWMGLPAEISWSSSECQMRCFVDQVSAEVLIEYWWSVNLGMDQVYWLSFNWGCLYSTHDPDFIWGMIIEPALCNWDCSNNPAPAFCP